MFSIVFIVCSHITAKDEKEEQMEKVDVKTLLRAALKL
jgi:hypothetical protein